MKFIWDVGVTPSVSLKLVKTLGTCCCYKHTIGFPFMFDGKGRRSASKIGALSYGHCILRGVRCPCSYVNCAKDF